MQPAHVPRGPTRSRRSARRLPPSPSSWSSSSSRSTPSDSNPRWPQPAWLPTPRRSRGSTSRSSPTNGRSTNERALVRHQAILSYIDAGSDSSGNDTALFSGSGSDAQAASEYTSLAIGDITTALDQLHTAQHTLQAHQDVLEQREAQDRADQAGQAADVAGATAAAGQLQSEQALVSGQLATAVAQQQAAQSAAAAAAVARARRAAPRPVASTSTVRSSSTVPTIPAPPQTTSTVTSAPVASGTNAPVGDPNLPDPALNPFLQCVVRVESGGNYGAISPDGLYRGAFQFSQGTWDSAAQAAGLSYLVGVPPNQATKAEQDTVAVALYALDGEQPWLGDRCSS